MLDARKHDSVDGAVTINLLFLFSCLFKRSQFFITLAENLDSLDGKHSVFGEVVEEESFEVLDKINVRRFIRRRPTVITLALSRTLFLTLFISGRSRFK